MWSAEDRLKFAVRFATSEIWNLLSLPNLCEAVAEKCGRQAGFFVMAESPSSDRGP